MAVFRYGGLLIIGIMILTSCGSLAVKDQPVDQPTKSGAKQPPAKGAVKEQPVDRPTKSGAEQLPAKGAVKEQPVDRPAQTGAEQLPAKGAVTEQPVEQPTLSGAELLLANGIRSYEDGEYKSAAAYLQNAVKAGLPRKTDIAKAHKYLAFIACGEGNTRRCRDEFRKAFAADPSFALDAAETGHPVWGPIYKRVQDEVKSKKKRK